MQDRRFRLDPVLATLLGELADMPAHELPGPIVDWFPIPGPHGRALIRAALMTRSDGAPPPGPGAAFGL